MGIFDFLKSGKANTMQSMNAEDCYQRAESLYQANKYSESIEWYEKAASMGSEKAMNALGYSYMFGEGVEEDFNRAADLFRMAIRKGSTKAAANLGRLWAYYGYEMDDAEVYQALKMGAEAGEEIAFAPFANCYYYACGCDENQKLAAYWAFRSYQEGMIEAYELLARFYHEGYFVPQIPSIEKYCYLKLQEAGADVSTKLNQPEFTNLKPVEPLVPHFDDQSSDFFTQECPHVQYIKGLMQLHGTDGENQIPVNPDKGEALLKLAANQGYAAAQYSLGIKYIDPLDTNSIRYDTDGSVNGFVGNNPLGIQLLKKAADQGDYEAIDCMIMLTYEDIGITEDECEYYQKLQEQIYQDRDFTHYEELEDCDEMIEADKEILKVLEKIVGYIGTEGFSNGTKVCALFGDLAPKKQKERRRVKMAYQSNAVAILLNAKDHRFAVNEAVKRMVDYSDMADHIATATILAIYEILK